VTEFLIITGLSGAGRSTAADTFEDLGWFVIDNMPPALINHMTGLARPEGVEPLDKVALVVGRGGGEWLRDLAPAIAELKASDAKVHVLFLEAADEDLVRRFEGNRRRHPMIAAGVVESIRQERALLEPIKEMADVVVDTSDLNVHQLRDRLVGLFAADQPSAMQTSVVSFGYKHGVPLDADLVLDCRFLPNPHWVDELRPLTGLDKPVQDYVLGQPETAEFLEKLDDLLGVLLPAFVKEGKSYLTVAVGCTGGHHRSVVLAEEISAQIAKRGFRPTVTHRDVNND
jgi:UPF0042 nucleotide-binding protein